jgi:hypothetical protein
MSVIRFPLWILRVGISGTLGSLRDDAIIVRLSPAQVYRLQSGQRSHVLGGPRFAIPADAEVFPTP